MKMKMRPLVMKMRPLVMNPLWTRNVYDDPPPEVKVFKQEDVDKIVADARRKDEAEIQKHTNELKKLKESAGLTKKERDDLQTRIDDLNNQYKTKEQLAAQEIEKTQSKAKEELELERNEKSRWKESFETTTITNAVLRTTSADAVNAEIMEDLIRPKSRVVEGKDAEGKPNGLFTVMVKIGITNKKTKTVEVMDLPIDEAIKQMKEDVPRFGNLFKSTIQGGVGGSGGGGSRGTGQAGPLDGETIKNMTDAEYVELRKRHGLNRR